jgi:uncharacterized iron-regulated membrane protein
VSTARVKLLTGVRISLSVNKDREAKWPETLVRALHRWLMTLAVIVLGWLAVTGILMQVDGITALLAPSAANVSDHAAMREGPSGPGNFTSMSAPSAFARALPDAQLQALLTRAMAAARRAEPDQALISLELRAEGAQRQAVFYLGDPATRRLVFDIDTGQRIAGPAFPGDLPDGPHDAVTPISTYGTFKSLHQFSFLGVGGLWLDGFVALALLLLSLSGLWLYGSMYLKRQKLNRHGLFWE